MSSRGRSSSSGDRKSVEPEGIQVILQQLKAMQNTMKTEQANMQEYIKTEQTNMQQYIKIEQANLQANMQEYIKTEQTNMQEYIKNELVEVQTSIQTLHTQNVQLQERLEQNESRVEEKLKNIEERIGSYEQNTNVRIESLAENTEVRINELQTKVTSQINETQGICKEQQQFLIQEIKQVDEQVMRNSSKLGVLEHTSVEIQGELDIKTRSWEEWKQQENLLIEQMKKEIENFKRYRSSTRVCESKSVFNPALKPEIWPKFDGTKQKLHPITYLKNILKLIKDIDDQSLALTIIQLTLEERALEWFQMVVERCKTVEHFAKEFEKQYWNTSHQDRQKLVLLTGKYKEGRLSRENYAIDVYNRSKNIPNLTESEIAKYLLNHFVISDNQAIVCQNVDNMGQLIEMLRKLDDLSDLQRANRLNQNNYQRNNLNYNFSTPFHRSQFYPNAPTQNGNFYSHNNRFNHNANNNYRRNYTDHNHNNGNNQPRENNGGQNNNFRRNNYHQNAQVNFISRSPENYRNNFRKYRSRSNSPPINNDNGTEQQELSGLKKTSINQESPKIVEIPAIPGTSRN